MRSITEELKEVIAEEFHCEPINTKTLRLCEIKSNLSVDIRLLKSDKVFCFSIDKDRNRKISKRDQVFPFFNPNKKGLCKKNDFILVCQKGKQIYVFLIELKSKNDGDYLVQMQAGKIFFDFVIERLKLCSLDDELIKLLHQDIIFKGILFLREIPEKNPFEHKKVKFTNDSLPITRQSYNNQYLINQFL